MVRSDVAAPSDNYDLHILNPTAAAAWRLFASRKSVDEAASEFAAFYDLPLHVAERDLQLTWDAWKSSLLAPTALTTSVSPPSAPDPKFDASAFSCVCHLDGRNVQVILYDPALVDEVAPRLEPLLTPACRPDAIVQASASDGHYHVFTNGCWVATRDHPADARVALLQELAKTAHGDKWSAVLHAAACGTQSTCVIFPAATHSGKTTLAAILMHCGFQLYADDSVALDRETLAISAMPFSLMIREGSWPLVSARFPEFENLPVYNRYGQNVRFLHPTGQLDGAKARACAIVFSRWEPDAQLSINTLNALETLVRFKDSGFWLAHDRPSIQNFLDWLAGLPAYEMTYSDVDEAVDAIRRFVST